MKTKITIVLTILALVTLSFTFTNGKTSYTKKAKENPSVKTTEPSGGFLSEDKF